MSLQSVYCSFKKHGINIKNKCKLIGIYVYWFVENVYVCVTFYCVSLFLVMLKYYRYQHNYILSYAVWWLIIVSCTWDGLDPNTPMTRRINEVPSKINLTNKFFYIRCVFCLHGSIVWIFYLVESHFKKLLYILRNISGINWVLVNYVTR